MKRGFSRLWLSSFLLALPAPVLAQGTYQPPGVLFNLQTVLEKLVWLGASWIGAFCITLFLIGAFVKVAAAGNETHSKRGNQIMIGSIIGLCIVGLSYTIIKMVFFVIY